MLYRYTVASFRALIDCIIDDLFVLCFFLFIYLVIVFGYPANVTPTNKYIHNCWRCSSSHGTASLFTRSMVIDRQL